MRYLLIFLLCMAGLMGVQAQQYDEWVQKSFELLEKNEPEQAESCLKEALRKEPANPQNALLLTNLGTIQRRLGKKEDALISYSSALMLMPRSVMLLGNRAALFAEQEKWEDAEADYTAILYLEEDHEESLYHRGFIRLERGDTLAARTDFERIVKSNPTSSRGRLGIAALLKASKNYVMAAEMYTQVIKANEKQASLYLKRAEVYYLDGKLSKAVSDINRSIELDAEDPMAYLIRGRIRYAQYDRASALEDFQKAKDMGFLDPIVDKMIKKCK